MEPNFRLTQKNTLSSPAHGRTRQSFFCVKRKVSDHDHHCGTHADSKKRCQITTTTVVHMQTVKSDVRSRPPLWYTDSKAMSDHDHHRGTHAHSKKRCQITTTTVVHMQTVKSHVRSRPPLWYTVKSDVRSLPPLWYTCRQ